MATFVYLVLPEVSSGIGIMLLCGVFISQILVDFTRLLYHNLVPTAESVPVIVSNRNDGNTIHYIVIHSQIQTRHALYTRDILCTQKLEL